MPDLLTRIAAALAKLGVNHECHHDCIHVPLAAACGVLEVKLWPDGTDSIQLLDGDFHTHLDVLALAYGVERDAAFVHFLRKVLDAELLLILETTATGVTRTTIVESLEEYLGYLPDGAIYQILNKT